METRLSTDGQSISTKSITNLPPSMMRLLATSLDRGQLFSCKGPTFEETEEAINLISNRKAPGSDAIPAEIIKHGDLPLPTYSSQGGVKFPMSSKMYPSSASSTSTRQEKG